MIMKYFGKRCKVASVENELGTDEDGTSSTDIERVLRKNGLEVEVHTRMDLRHLKYAINDGYPVLVSLYEGWHFSVVYGNDSKHIFVMHPSLGEMGSVKCAVRSVEEYSKAVLRMRHCFIFLLNLNPAEPTNG